MHFLAPYRLFFRSCKLDSLGEFCGRINTPTIMRSPFPVTNVVFRSFAPTSDKGFNLTRSVSNCGGVYGGPNHRISFPGSAVGDESGNYPPNYDCVWLFQFEEGTQIEVSGTTPQ